MQTIYSIYSVVRLLSHYSRYLQLFLTHNTIKSTKCNEKMTKLLIQTTGLAENNGSLLLGDDLKSHLRADSMYTGISSRPNSS